MQYRVGIDQLKIAMAFNQEEKHDPKYEAYVGMMEWVGSVRSKQVFDPVPGQEVVFKRGKPPAAWTSARQPLTLGGDLEVWYGRHTGALRARVRMNRSKSDLGELNVHFVQMLPAGFDTLYRHGRVTYGEFFIDVDGVSFEDYLFLDPKLRAWDAGWDEDGTMYLGTKLSHRRFAIYDKAREISNHLTIALPVSRLRLEARLRGAYGFSAEKLPELPNPFTDLAVISRTALESCSAPSARRLWGLVEKGFCAQQAFALLDPSDRKALQALLPELAPPWWQPHLMWASYVPGIGWIETLRQAGRNGEWLPLGVPVPHSGAMIPAVGKAMIGGASEPENMLSPKFASPAIDCTPVDASASIATKAHHG